MSKLTMPYELLSTKLTVPRLPTSFIERDPLLNRLDAAVQHKLTLIAAPAGFGKTTLVSAWMLRQTSPCAWVSLDDGDNDPVRFWRYVITACMSFDPRIGMEALATLNTKSTFERALTLLINDLMLVQPACVLVLEDYHVIDVPEIHASFAYFLEHLPDHLHLIMLTRSEPPLPLARLRASDDLREFHAADLRFSTAEIQAFLQQALHFPVSADIVQQLETRTEGWSAALRLLTLSWQGIDQFLSNRGGSYRAISDYLITEVFRSQSYVIQDFLLQTAFLSRLSPELCNEITQRQDSHSILEELERLNLFLVPLGNDWYRYHPLFGETIHQMAKRTLGEDQLRNLYARASVWFEQQALYSEAIELALDARAFLQAERLIEHLIQLYIFCELHTMRRWLERLPKDLFLANPMLCLMYASAVLFSSNRYAPATHQQFEEALQAAQRSWEQQHNLPMLGMLYNFKAGSAWWQGQVYEAIALSKKAAPLLAEEDYDSRGINTIYLGWEQLYQGEIHAARAMLHEGQTLCRISKKSVYTLRAVTLVLGEVCLRAGYFHQAAHIFEQLLVEIGDAPDSYEDRGMALAGLGWMAYERNQLEEAENYVQQAYGLGKQISDTLIQALTLLILARVRAAQGNYSAALELTHTCLTFITPSLWEPLHREILADQAGYALMIGDEASVQQWAKTLSADVPPLQQEREALLLARWWMSQEKYEQAQEILAPWLADSAVKGRLWRQVENLVMQAQIHFRQDKLASAKQTLMQALTLAYPEGYQRLFAESVPLLQLLTGENLSVPLMGYVQQLLAAFGSAEALSPQEVRVLKLLAVGLSNPEIADELVVSVNTIKTQVKSIYRKLGISSRQEVSEAAQRLKLG